MTVSNVSLVNGLQEMLLYPRPGLVLLNITAPGPAIRQVTESRPDDDGEDDTTQRYGGRAVSIELLAVDTPAAFVEELGGWLHPALRPYLVVTDDEWAQSRRIQLRADQWTAPMVADQAPTQRNIQAQWRAPYGIWEASDETTVIVPADVPSTVGFSFPITFPLALDPTTATGALELTNVGNTPSHFVARLYGPCTAPSLVNDLTGSELTFTSALTLAAGDYVEVDTRNHTALLLSDTDQSRLGYLDFEVSEWWQIQAGTQQIRYTATSPTAGSQAEITYRPAWL